MSKSNGIVEPPFTSRRATVDGAVEEIATLHGFGATVTRADLERMFHIVWPEKTTRKDHQTLNAVFVGLKSEMEEQLLKSHQMAMRPHGKGRWEIVKPQDQAKYAATVARRGIADSIARSSAIVQNIRRDGLTDAQRREADDTAARLAGIEALMSRGLRGPAQTPRLPKQNAMKKGTKE